MSLELQTLEQGKDTIVVRVTGEVDVSNADELRAAVYGALDSDPDTLEVDLEGVSYIDSTGIGVLVGALNRARESGVSFAVCNPQHNVARVLSLLGVDKQLGMGSQA